jgi:hypothetical protein
MGRLLAFPARTILITDSITLACWNVGWQQEERLGCDNPYSRRRHHLHRTHTGWWCFSYMPGIKRSKNWEQGGHHTLQGKGWIPGHHLCLLMLSFTVMYCRFQTKLDRLSSSSPASCPLDQSFLTAQIRCQRVHPPTCLPAPPRSQVLSAIQSDHSCPSMPHAVAESIMKDLGHVAHSI